jgi:hypothetical protein
MFRKMKSGSKSTLKENPIRSNIISINSIINEMPASTQAMIIFDSGRISFGKYIFRIKFCFCTIAFEPLLAILENKFHAIIPEKANR